MYFPFLYYFDQVNELDNRASNFYIALYWAEFMAMEDPEYHELARQLKDHRKEVVAQLKVCQGKATDAGGYYKFDDKLANNCMRPSPIFNEILEGKGKY